MHLQANGFEVRVSDVADLAPMKVRHGVSPALEACHTATVDGRYVIEGHVPAEVIRQLLDEQPDVAGLSVPGMPIGSPGMEIPGRAPEQYDVLAFDKTGRIAVYARR